MITKTQVIDTMQSVSIIHRGFFDFEHFEHVFNERKSIDVLQF